jgi:4'-phosphopantetheinyl transferase
MEGEALVGIWWAEAGDINTSTLSHEEQIRASRFVDPRDRALHSASFALRRLVLGRLTGIAPQDISFEYRCAACGGNDHGAPRLLHSQQFTFSVSHRRGICTIAATRSLNVGIDIEYDTGSQMFDTVRPLILNAKDDASLSTIRLWTAKEATLKHALIGLSAPPSSVIVSADTNDVGTAQLTHSTLNRCVALSWFEISTSYTISVATDYSEHYRVAPLPQPARVRS